LWGKDEISSRLQGFTQCRWAAALPSNVKSVAEVAGNEINPNLPQCRINYSCKKVCSARLWSKNRKRMKTDRSKYNVAKKLRVILKRTFSQLSYQAMIDTARF